MLIHDFLCRLRQGGKDVHEVVVDGNSVVINKNGRACNALSLEAVDAVWAHNREMQARDELFLAFDTGQRTVWISDRCAGFDKLSQEIESRFPLNIADWYTKLTGTAAIDEESVLLWRRA